MEPDGGSLIKDNAPPGPLYQIVHVSWWDGTLCYGFNGAKGVASNSPAKWLFSAGMLEKAGCGMYCFLAPS